MARPPTTLERLRVFHAVVATGTIAGAARALDYTPSAVSQHLSALEREVRVALVERSNRGVVPTDAGRLLAGLASDVLDQVHDAFDQVAAAAGRQEATVAVAAFPTAITSMLLPLVDSLAPGIRLTIVDAEAEAAVEAVRNREVDCAVTDGHASDSPLEDLYRTVVRVEPIQLITRSDRAVRHLADCADAPWVLGGARSRLAAAARQACAAAGFAPHVIAESDDHHVTFDVIRATGAVSLLPEMANAQVPDGVQVAHEVDTGVDRRVEFVTRHPLRANPAISRLAQLLVAADPLAQR